MVPVLGDIAEQGEETAQGWQTRSGEAAPVGKPGIAVVAREAHALFVGAIGWPQIEAEGGAPGQRGIEEVDGKVGADAAIGEPAALQLLPAGAIVHGVQRYGAEQQGKAQAHAHGDDYRQVIG